MPTLISGNGGLESGESAVNKAQPFFSSATKRLGLILWIAWATGATDAIAQQWANNNLPPKAPALVAPAVPGGVEDAPQIPTGPEVISILQNGKDKIKAKFNTFNDAIFAQIVGAISLGDVKPETLDALASAWPAWSEEQKTILAFSKWVKESKLKPAVVAAVKKPLTAEEKKQEKIKGELLTAFNKNAEQKSSWKRSPLGDQDVDVDEKAWKITIKYKKMAGKENSVNPNWIAVMRGQLWSGDYELFIDSDSESGAILWLNDAGGKSIGMDGNLVENARIKLWNGRQILKIPRNAANYTIGFSVTPLNPVVIVNSIKLSKAPDGMVANK